MCTCDPRFPSYAERVRGEPRVRLTLPDAFGVVLLQSEAEDQDLPGHAAEAFPAKFGWDPRAAGLLSVCARGVKECARLARRTGTTRQSDHARLGLVGMVAVLG